MQLEVPAELLKEEYRAAKVVYLENSVLFRRPDSAEWGKAALQMDLFGRDTVYTMAASRAEVRFHTGETLGLTPNTLVVLRPPGKRKADAEMLAGELLSRRSRVVTRTAIILPKTADAEFSARMKKDLTTVVSVTRGVAEVEAQGKRVEVRKGYVTEVRLDRAPSAPVALAAPEAGTGAAVPVPDRAPPPPASGPPPAGQEAWLPANALDSVYALSGYQLQVAKDRDFSVVVLDRTYGISEKPDLGRLLAPGDYFIRAAKIDLLGYKEKFSAPRPIKIKDGGR
jgi:hypothetical protein